MYENYIYVTPNRTSPRLSQNTLKKLELFLVRLNSNPVELENAIRLVGYHLDLSRPMSYSNRILKIESALDNQHSNFEFVLERIIKRYRLCIIFFNNHLNHFDINIQELIAAIDLKFPRQNPQEVLNELIGQWWSKYVFGQKEGYFEFLRLIQFVMGEIHPNKDIKIGIPAGLKNTSIHLFR